MAAVAPQTQIELQVAHHSSVSAWALLQPRLGCASSSALRYFAVTLRFIVALSALDQQILDAGIQRADRLFTDLPGWLALYRDRLRAFCMVLSR